MGIASITKPFYYIYLGILSVSIGLYNLLKYASIGLYVTFKKIFVYITDIFKYAGIGLKLIFSYLYKPFKKRIEILNKKIEEYKEKRKFLKANKEKNTKAKQKKKISEKQKIKYEVIRAELLKELNPDNVKRTDVKQVYQYIVADKEGNISKGIFSGYSKLDVNAYLVNEGYEVYSIKTSKWLEFLYGQSKFKGKKMSTKDLIFWLTQLNTYLKSGIPLTDAMKILSNQMGKKGNRKRLFTAIVYELTMGESFSAALEHQEGVFPSLLINMLKAAEATGELEETLDDMTDYYTEINSTRKAMISAMTYPAIITVFSFGVITFILIYVIPQFVQVYENSGIEIGGLTATIINISLFLQNNIALILLVLVIAIAGLVMLYKKVKLFRSTVQKILMHIPLVGNIIIYNEITIFTKTFSSLLRNNVLITESVNILSKVTSNEIYRNIMFETISNVTKGIEISKSFENHWAVPEVAYYMLVTGESTAELPDMMSRVSRYYQELHRSLIDNLKAFIEPVMIVSLALIVGVIILAVIIPMFDLYGQIT